MIQNLRTAHWAHSRKKAELLTDSIPLIKMEFKKKQTFVKMGEQKFEISKDGFWCPKIIITENEKIIAIQKQLGFWGTKSEFVLDDQAYIAKTKQGMLFNITYSFNGIEILTYKLDALKTKPVIRYEIKNADIPGKHLMILLALGFYSMKNVAIEAMSSNFIVTAVA
jgi:hypothetical protein